MRGMDTGKLLKHYGDRQTAMKELGIYRQVWNYWANKGIPEGWQYKIQHLTGGRLKAKNAKAA